MQKFLLFFVTVLLLSNEINAQAPRGKGITFAPMLHNFKLDRGGKATSTLYITNNMTRDYQMEVKVGDWVRGEDGSVKLFEPGTNSTSCANWVSVDKNLIELKAGGEASVNITMNVPDSATAVEEMKWCMLLVTTMAEKKAPRKYGQIQSQLTQRFGSQVVISNEPPSITNKQANIESFEAVTDTSYSIRSSNLGALMLKCTTRLVVSSDKTGQKHTVESDAYTLFPGEIRNAVLSFPKLEPGRYTLVAFVDAHDDEVELVASQKVIEIK